MYINVRELVPVKLQLTSSNKSSQVNAVDAVHGGVQWTLVVWMCAGDAKGSDVAVTLLNT